MYHLATLVNNVDVDVDLSSTANKYEFLNLAYQLIDRLTTLAHLTYPLRYLFRTYFH
jgi:hypothetical protein